MKGGCEGGKQVWGEEGQGLPGNEAEQTGVVGASQQHKQAQAQQAGRAPHHGVDTPAPAQGQEVEVVEVGGDVGDAWGRGAWPCRGHCHSLHNCPHFNHQKSKFALIQH